MWERDKHSPLFHPLKPSYSLTRGKKLTENEVTDDMGETVAGAILGQMSVQGDGQCLWSPGSQSS